MQRPLEYRPTAIVTGAGSGLGRAIALELARQRYEIALADINTAAAEETAELVRREGGVPRVVALDVTDLAQWQTLRDTLQGVWPRLDLLVNNAGVGSSGPIERLQPKDWQWVVDTNLSSVFYGCHTFTPWLKQNAGRARVLNVASFAAFAGVPTLSPYNATKAGVVALSETLHGELRSAGVRVTVACPLFFKTNLLAKWRFCDESQREDGLKQMERGYFTADEVAAAALRASEQGRLYVVIGWRARLLWWFKRLAPQRFIRLSGWAFERQSQQAANTQGQVNNSSSVSDVDPYVPVARPSAKPDNTKVFGEMMAAPSTAAKPSNTFGASLARIPDPTLVVPPPEPPSTAN